MTLLGLSILIASVSFLCYRHPPSSWVFLDWLRRPALRDGGKRGCDAPGAIAGHSAAAESREDGASTQEATKEDVDRKAMPPPPLFVKKPEQKPPSPPTTPRASTSSASPQVPVFDVSHDSSPAPSFPAANSAQRASGGRTGPSRLNPVPTLQPLPGLMSPPMRSPLPNRTPTGSNFSSSLALPPSHNSIPTKPSKKVLLSPGHSPLDWARLAASPTANLRGLEPSSPYLRVPPSLLKKYTGRKGNDAWTVLGGKVYNITPYLPYHPGGEPELMKAAGRDGTKLFGEVHPWVNWEGMLEGCLIGIAVEERDVKAQNSLEEMD